MANAVPDIITDHLPDDVRIVPVVACAAAWNLSERKARQVLEQEGVAIVEFGPRSSGIRLSDAREVVARRERTKGAP
jgi:hypothetical protein